jgi:hypothetical protein
MKIDDQVILQGLMENPEVAMVLEIASRARQVEAQTLPQDFRVSSEVTVVPVHLQHITGCQA